MSHWPRLQPGTDLGGSVVKLLTCLLLATMLGGCLPVGIRANNLPNYAGAAKSTSISTSALRHAT
jgi:hypothetical protein